MELSTGDLEEDSFSGDDEDNADDSVNDADATDDSDEEEPPPLRIVETPRQPP